MYVVGFGTSYSLPFICDIRLASWYDFIYTLRFFSSSIYTRSAISIARVTDDLLRDCCTT